MAESVIVRRPDYSKVRREVEVLLADIGAREPPVNVRAIAAENDIQVKFVSFSGKFAGVSGFYDPRENAIFVNKDEYPLRQTFTIAHELGHALMHREWAASENYKLLWRNPDENDKDSPIEKEANAFAASLLVPRSMLDKYSGLSVSDLSRLFAVSVPVIKNRLDFEFG